MATIPLLSQEKHSLVIYRKSLKSTAGIAIGVVCCSATAIIHTFQDTLSTHTTEDQAELLVLLAAVKYAVSCESSHAKYAILCSSTSALNDCTKNPKISGTAIQCRQLYYDNQQNIHLFLVGGAEGISLAREGTKSCLNLNSQPVNQHPWSLRLIKETIKTDSETVEHFLFHCIRFTEQRAHLIDTFLRNGKPFPPSLDVIPKNRYIWNAFKIFIRSTERLKIRSTAHGQ